MPAYEIAPLTWEAVSTFATGAMAVGAAIWVGRRQTNILKQQTNISDAVRELESLKVKTELFDRRIAVYRAVEEWILAFHANDGFPENDIEHRYSKACAEASFLFEDNVVSTLNKWRRAANRYRAYKKRLEAIKDEEYTRYMDLIADQEDILLEASAEALDLFRDALDLSRVR